MVNSNEIKLEEISSKVTEFKSSKYPPVFELYITLFSILMSAMMFLFPDMLHDSVPVTLGAVVLGLMPQYVWASVFFVAGMLKAIGLLVDNNTMRTIGLFISAVTYVVFSVGHILAFPSIGSVTFICMSVFTVLSITMVKHTGIK